MKALAAPSYGPVDRLVVRDVPDRAPGPAEILILIRAAALNPLDVKLVTGQLSEMFPVEHPFVPGMDATGVVAATGAGVSRFTTGDEVIVHTGAASGTVAEYVLTADGPHLVHRPPSLDPVRAAALPTAAMTAHCVLAAAGIQPDDTLLVVGATGGVGAYVVQLAAKSGARVLATAAPDDAGYIRGLGASAAINHTVSDTYAEARRLCPQGVDVVVDLINTGPELKPAAHALRPGGRLISTLYGPQEVNGATVVYVRMDAAVGDLAKQAQRAANGEISVEVAATYPFDRGAEAMRDLAAGRYTRGKIIVTF
ncbi:NADP-dependent oxidoreductase [Nonomuraea dietziae]|uniref:NADP-dependent oxidoreductase n=1 Tax=Nonomuraea dietziae TaxID=65515 RepID=UPI0033E63DAF